MSIVVIEEMQVSDILIKGLLRFGIHGYRLRNMIRMIKINKDLKIVQEVLD